NSEKNEAGSENNSSANSITDSNNNSFRSRGNTRGRNNFRSNNYKNCSNIRCYNCGKEGHIQKNCWSNNNDKNISGNNNTSGSMLSSQSFVTNNNNNNNSTACAFTIFTPHSCSYMSDNKNNNSEWLLDSGASSHFTGDRSLLYNIVKLKEPLIAKTGNGISNYSEIGDINLLVNNKMIILKEVIYIPKFSANLISIGRIVNNNIYNVVLDYNGVKVIDKSNNQVYLSGVREGNMFKISETHPV